MQHLAKTENEKIQVALFTSMNPNGQGSRVKRIMALIKEDLCCEEVAAAIGAPDLAHRVQGPHLHCQSNEFFLSNSNINGGKTING